MQDIGENSTIEKILTADKNACKVLEEAKERGNQIIQESRMEANILIAETKEDLQKKRVAIEKEYIAEGEKEVAGIMAEKEERKEKLKMRALLQQKQLMNILRKIIFDDLVKSEGK